ncbi:MAG TPA: AAA family ATPase [Parafilimonas sp.]|nr:AAA family ATPase [Parafilimonas sp.]
MEATEMQLRLGDIFEEKLFGRRPAYINCLRLFYTSYKTIPDIKAIGNIDTEKLIRWLEANMKKSIIKKHTSQHYDDKQKAMENVQAVYFIGRHFILDVDGKDVNILFSESQEALAQQLLNDIKKFAKKEKKMQQIYLVTSTLHGLDTTRLKLRKPNFNIARLYNDNFEAVHQTIIKNMKQKHKSGLILLHGLPGTGKSTYIRFLATSINKKVIFMPPRLAGNLDTPDFSRFLVKNANTVFVIEDAEELLVSRESNKNSSISMLLNLTDGLLGESLGIQIIATFNTNLNKIDKALSRKGRLLALYEFKPLCVEKSNLLLEELGIKNFKATQPMTLSEIFNKETESFTMDNQKKPIGFLSEAG